MHLFISAGNIHQLFVMKFFYYIKYWNILKGTQIKGQNNVEYKITNMKRKFKKPGRKFFILNQLVKGRTAVILSCV